PLLAAERGVEVRLVTNAESPDFRNLITLRGTLANGRQVSVAGTLVGPKHIERLVQVDGFDLEIEPTDHMLVLRYVDRPGVIAVLGRILGEANVNIAGMQVSRDRKGGLALAVLTVDSSIPQGALDALAEEIQAHDARAVDLAA